MGARTPLSEIVPLRTCITAIWHVMLVLLLVAKWCGEPRLHSALKINGKLTDAAWNAHELRHGRWTARSDRGAVFAEGRAYGVLAAVFVLNLEHVLEELDARY